MSERVERSNPHFNWRNRLQAMFGMICASTIAIVCLAAPAGAQDEDLSVLIRRLTSTHGLSVDQLADYLALGTPLDGVERRLVRWEQAEVALGVVASAGVTADMIDKIVAPIENTFDDVGRGLYICIRRSDREVSAAGDSRAFPDCQSRPVEIDLVLDISERSIFADVNGPQLPSESKQTFLRASWSKMREAVLAHTTEYFCSAGFATDVAAQKLVGGAGLIRPKPEQNALLTMTLCSRELAYYLLGVIPIAKPGDKGGYLSGDLLQLLYRTELQSGESRGEVLEKLQAASGN